MGGDKEKRKFYSFFTRKAKVDLICRVIYTIGTELITADFLQQ